MRGRSLCKVHRIPFPDPPEHHVGCASWPDYHHIIRSANSNYQLDSALAGGLDEGDPLGLEYKGQEYSEDESIDSSVVATTI